MIGAVAALALLPSLHLPALHAPHGVQNPFHPFKPGAASQVATDKTKLADGWRLSQTRDPFTGLSSCMVDAKGVRFSRGVVTFSFGPKTDTANALFRVDGGAVRNAGEVGPEVAGTGTSLFSRNAFNPSDGRVRLPWSTLRAAQRVDIRPNDRSYHRSFPLQGLNAALEQARGAGCTDLSA